MVRLLIEAKGYYKNISKKFISENWVKTFMDTLNNLKDLYGVNLLNVKNTSWESKINQLEVLRSGSCFYGEKVKEYE